MDVQPLHNGVMDFGWFKQRKKELGVTNEVIADSIGRHVSIVSKILGGKIPFDVKHVNGFAKALQTTRNEILEKAGVLEPGVPGVALSNALPIAMEGPSSEKMRANLPVYGTALGATKDVNNEAIEQTTLNTAEIVQYVKRPVLLNDRADAYGLYVQGSSMAPAHEDGSMVVVAPNMPLRIGDYVVVYLRPTDPDQDDGETARAVLLKRLVKRNGSYMELEQFQPPRTFKVSMSEIVRTDRVLTMTDMLS